MRFENLPNFVFIAAVLAGIGYYGYRGLQGIPEDPGLPSDSAFAASLNGPTEFTLVKFGAEWCPPCRAIEPELDSLAVRMQGRVRVMRVNVDKRPELARHYGVRSIPRLLLFRQGKLVADMVGGMDAAGLEKWVVSASKR